ncbi:MAG TPA: magnesium/cobalt transporter CorA [Actinomycetota bacterium]|nr:magnesium/cobalt transporter CorA [Actinomycetota bacterium]
MARVTYRLSREGVLREEPLEPERLDELLAEDSARLWVDVEEPTEDDLDQLQRSFGLHPLAVEDSRHWGQRPKVEVFPDHLFLVLHALSLDDRGELVDREIHLFVGRRFLVTLRAAPPFDLSRVLQRLEAEPDLARQGAGFLLYTLLDEIVDGYLDIVERYEDLSDEIEDRVFADEPDPTIQADIFRMKRRVVELRRVVVPLREVIDFVQEQPGLVPQELGPYFRDVADHVIRTIEFIDNIRELLTTALEAQISQVSNRLNRVMKSLTSWGAIILVPTLIAGIYGMNFRHMPELGWRFGYPFALGLMLASAAALYAVFKRKDWL